MKKSPPGNIPAEPAKPPHSFKPEYLFQIDKVYNQFIGWSDVKEVYSHSIVRYALVGIRRRGLFTGYIHDYNGGGSWMRRWILDSQCFEHPDYGDDGPETVRACRRIINSKYPGLTAAIDDILKQFLRWRDGEPRATTAARAEHEKVGDDYLVTRGRLQPITIANTVYEHAVPLREPLVFLDKNTLCTQGEYERLMEQDAD